MFLATTSDTKMWSIKKKKFVEGPKLNHRFEKDKLVFGYNTPGCAATLNKSHFAMIAFHNKDDPISLFNQRFALVNFQTQQITDYPNLPFEIVYFQNQFDFKFKFCSASILHMKNNDKSLVTHIQYLSYLVSFMGTSYKKFSYLMSYNLNQGVDGQWKVHGTWKVDDDTRLLNFWQVRGSFYSLFSDGNFIHHQNLYGWQTLANFSHNFTRFVGNGAIYYV